jgi:multicomponent Na+:H+ antiporter subunit C
VEVPVAFLVGVLVACGLYLMMQRNLLRFVFGLLLLSGAVNVLIFAAGRLMRWIPPIIPEGHAAPVAEAANALPQAVVLTAIVIGFGLIAFTLVLVLRVYERLGTVITEELGPALRQGEAPEGEAS